MDEGRLYDLARLKRVVNDPTKSKNTRKWADKTRKIIVRQLKDRKLRRLREQLIKASKAHDEHTELKIVNTIKNYLREEKIEV